MTMAQTLTQNLTLPQVTKQRVQLEDGTYANLTIAQMDNNEAPRPIDLRDNPYGNPGAPAGRAPQLVDKGRKKAVLWRGNVPSRIPAAHVMTYLEHGWTTEPTLPLPALDFPCGVMMPEGPCTKKLRTRIDRLRHIRAYHPDAALFTFTDDEKRVLRGELGLSALDPKGGGASSDEVTELRAMLERQQAMIEFLLTERQQTDSTSVPPASAQQATVSAQEPEPVKIRKPRPGKQPPAYTRVCEECGKSFTSGATIAAINMLKKHQRDAHASAQEG